MDSSKFPQNPYLQLLHIPVVVKHTFNDNAGVGGFALLLGFVGAKLKYFKDLKLT
ncbi:MAG: hypothetical protein ABIG86_03135 [Patescibacteria group bacterium]